MPYAVLPNIPHRFLIARRETLDSWRPWLLRRQRRIRGTVTDLAGKRHHVLVVVHSQLGPNGFVDRVSKINVN